MSSGDFPKGHIPWNKGMKMPFKHRKMNAGFMPVKAYKKGAIPWNKGKEFTAIRDAGNSQWKGEKAKPDAIHKWVIGRLGKPDKCDNCGTTDKRRYHWSNISHVYKRDLMDWQRLCVPCHKRYDLDFIKNEKRTI